MPTPNADNDSRQTALVVYALWLAVLAIGFLLPTERAWGFNLLAFASPITRLLALAVAIGGAAYIVFAGNRPVAIKWTKSRWAAITFVVCVGVLAAILYSREALLGDGTLRATDAADSFRLLPSEILPTLAAGAIIHKLPFGQAIDGINALRVVSILSTLILAVFLWILAPRVTEPPRRSLLFWILTFGSVRLLAGYVETYTTAFAFFTLWALAAWGYFNGRIGRTWLVAFWVTAMLSHVTAILLVPASAWLLWRESELPNALGKRGLIAILLGMGVVAASVVAGFYEIQVKTPGTGHFFISFLPSPPHSYGFFSPAHMLDFVNHWLLVAPAAAMIGGWMLLRRFRTRKDRQASQWEARGQRWQFWILVAAIPACAGLLIDPKLGWARDWDLFTVLSAPALAGIAIWLDQTTGAIRRAAMAVACVSSVIWLSFSVDGKAELARFESLLDLDPSRADYGHEIMAQHYHRQGDFEGVLRHYRAALAVSENFRYRLNIAAAYTRMGKFDDAERWYLGVIGRDSTNARAYHGLSTVYSEWGHDADAVAPAETAVALDPQNPDYNLRLGIVLLKLQRPEAALSHLEIAAGYFPNDPEVLTTLAQCYMKLNRLDRADLLIKQALAAQPNAPLNWLNAARTSFRRGAFTEAAGYIEQYRARVPASAQAADVRIMLDSIARATGPSN